jgi:hypothetical protein
MSANQFLVAFEAAAVDIPIGWTTYTAGIYGADLSCTDDCDPLFAEVDGTTPLVVAQDAWRTITSPRDSIPDAPGRGLDVRMFARRAATTAEVQSWAAQIRAELEDDDRIDTLDVAITQASVDTWEIAVSGTTVGNGTFALIGLLTPGGPILKELAAA